MKHSRQVKPVDASNGQTRETLALLRILAIGDQQIEAGEVQPANKALATLREKIQRRPLGD